jgi:hypothetical protein
MISVFTASCGVAVQRLPQLLLAAASGALCAKGTHPDGLLHPPNELTLGQGTHEVNVGIPIILLALKLPHCCCCAARSAGRLARDLQGHGQLQLGVRIVIME